MCIRDRCKYGQDLRHEQQITEMLSDTFTDIFTAESTILRAKKIMESDSPESTVVDIAKAYTTEMEKRIMANVRTMTMAIFDEKIPKGFEEKLSNFENRMRLNNNVIGLKRKIAQYVFDQNKYPY